MKLCIVKISYEKGKRASPFLVGRDTGISDIMGRESIRLEAVRGGSRG